MDGSKTWTICDYFCRRWKFVSTEIRENYTEKIIKKWSIWANKKIYLTKTWTTVSLNIRMKKKDYNKRWWSNILLTIRCEWH